MTERELGIRDLHLAPHTALARHRRQHRQNGGGEGQHEQALPGPVLKYRKSCATVLYVGKKNSLPPRQASPSHLLAAACTSIASFCRMKASRTMMAELTRAPAGNGTTCSRCQRLQQYTAERLESVMHATSADDGKERGHRACTPVAALPSSSEATPAK